MHNLRKKMRHEISTKWIIWGGGLNQEPVPSVHPDLGAAVRLFKSFTSNIAKMGKIVYFNTSQGPWDNNTNNNIN